MSITARLGLSVLVQVLVIALGAAGLIAWAISSMKAQRLLSAWPLHWIGRVSYSIYLVHILVLVCLTPHLLDLVGWPGRAYGWWAGLGLTIVVCCAVSAPLYLLAEVPSMRLGRWASSMLRPAAATPATTPRPDAGQSRSDFVLAKS